MTTSADDSPRLVDARGLKCPWPVLRAARAMRESGEILLLADDPVALIDVPALAAANRWTVEARAQGEHHRFHLKISPR